MTRAGSDQFALQTFDAMEAYLRASGHTEAAEEIARARLELQHHFDDRDRTPCSNAQTELPVPVPTRTPLPASKLPRRDRDPNYRLRVESITYLGDDVAAAHAIENFLALRRSRRQAPR